MQNVLFKDGWDWNSVKTEGFNGLSAMEGWDGND